MNQENPPPEGYHRLEAMVRRQVDPRASETAAAGGARADTLAGLEARMLEKLRGAIADRLAPVTRQMFILLPEQSDTLERLGVPRETRDGIRALGCLMMPPTEHRVTERLATIASMPPTPEGGVADWRRWWLEWRAGRIGVARPQDHDPARDQLAEVLNTVIAAMAREAEPMVPGPAETARHIIQEAEESPPKRGRKQEEATLPVRLSTVWAAGVRLGWLAHGIGLSPESVRERWGNTPEEVAEKLDAQGIPFRRDTGTVGDIRQLRGILDREGIRKTWMGNGGLRWYDHGAEEGWVVNHQPGGALDGNAWTGRSRTAELEGGPESGKGEGPAERELMGLTTPHHPLDRASVQGLVEVAAFLNRTTPDSARAYLEGRTEDPGPGEKTSCPQAEECGTPCGRLQESGEFPFPLNQDGDHSSCAYRGFLARHGRLTPEQREQAALAELGQARKDARRRERAEMERLGWIQPAGEDDGAPPPAEDQDQTEAPPVKPQPERMQPALF